ncbi:ATP-binding protein [Halobaculum sp. EA56]|uniref:ATP-binding protein n=1 Tax=Halobaculum sp. EA56 TaxID=3421648 RepID=UPI003EB99226
MTVETTTSSESTRSLVRIRLGSEPTAPESVTAAVRRIHRHLSEQDGNSTLEWLLWTTGESERVEYGLRCASSNADAITRMVRDIFPNTYSFDSERAPPEELYRTLGVRQDETSQSKEDIHDSPHSGVLGVKIEGNPDRRRDWQTSLTPFEEFRADESARLPLNSVVETLAASPVPVVFQVVLGPLPDWSAEAESRRLDLELGEDTLAQTALSYLRGRTRARREDSPRRGEGGEGELATTSHEYQHLGESVRRRLDHLAQIDSAACFDASVRAVALLEDGGKTERARALETCEELSASLSPLRGPYYDVLGVTLTDDRTRALSRAIREGRPTSRRIRDRLSQPYRLVVDPRETSALCLLDGASVTDTAKRALAIRPAEQTPRAAPPSGQLEPYREGGMLLGTPLDQDDIGTADPIALPPSLQPLHVGWVGKTGSGKSTALVNAILANHDATDGADILIDPKGDGMPREYLRAHYATYGTLENVYYFDCSETLPAVPFFDIRPELQEGLDRGQLVQNLVDHYIELLVAIMGRERFDQAIRSPDIIRYLVKAQFDPVHGFDAFSHRMLQYTARQLHETRDPPPVSDPDLESKLGGIAANSKRSFDELMQGVANRIEKATRDDRLNRLFNHVPERECDSNLDGTADDPVFDFIDVLDRDCVVIFDTGGLRSESQRVLTLVLLSNLWTALRRRAHRRTEAGLDGAGPLVNLYLEEAATVATSGLMSDLLAQSRGFGLSVTLAMQFPAQLRDADPRAYAELLNNVSTLVTGNISVDRDLAERLATDEMDAEDVGARLRALRRGQWLVNLPAPFGRSEPRPFLVESAPLPAGHPDGVEPLSRDVETTFEHLLAACAERTTLELGLRTAIDSTVSGETRKETTVPGDDDTGARLDSALPFTKRLPDYVDYDEAAHALSCAHCETRYDPTIEGMRTALACCGAIERVDRDDVPVCDLRVTLSRAEREATGYSDRQLLFLQAVYQAHQRTFDPGLEYDLLRDSMLRLQEYTGVEPDAVQELLDDGLLSHDGTHPHKLYTVTPEGRSVIQVAHKEGVAYGDGQGDLSESSLHVLMVEIGRRYIEQAYVEDPASPVVDAVSYHEVDGTRLDAAGLDATGTVVIALEAERSNHDTREGVPADYDKMALLNPEEAIWIVPNRETGHEVLHALNDPLSGPARVETTYSETVPPQRFELNSPGCTAIWTVSVAEKRLKN